MIVALVTGGVLVLIGQDGSIPGATSLAIGLSAIGLCILALAPPREGYPTTTWLAIAAGPPVLLAALHALPLGWHHPWVDADLAILGTTAGSQESLGSPSWSIDPGRSQDFAVWITALAVMVWCLLASLPIRRLPLLADGVVMVLAGYAAWAMALSMIGGSTGQHAWTVGGFAYHNHAGAAWAACLPLALIRAHAHHDWRWGLPIVLALAMVESASRGAIILGVLVSGPLLFILSGKKHRWLVTGLVGCGFIALLSLVGTGAAGQRFHDLRDGQAESLNGRVDIWRAATPVIAEVQPFGSGAGTADVAMQRAPGIDVAGAIDHLHSEPLEMLLEFGWVGLLVIATGLISGAILLKRVRITSGEDAERDRLGLGAGCGLLILAVHSLTDYILHNSVIDLIVVFLIAILVRSRFGPRTAPATKWTRTPVFCTGVVLLALTPSSWWRQHELHHLKNPSFPTEANVTAHTPEFAAAMAERLTVEPVRAAAWLGHAAHLAPGSAKAWRARILLATHEQQHDAALTACERLLTWAPDWDAGQDAVLACLAELPPGHLRDPRTTMLAHRLLTSTRSWPTPTWDLLGRILGEGALAELVRGLPDERMRASALPWLRQHAALDLWQAVRRETIPTQMLDPIQWRIVVDDGDPRQFTLAIARDRDGRREQAERCLGARFQLPPALDAALADDGEIATIHRQLGLMLAGKTQPTLRKDLDRLLHLSWVRPWWKLLHDQDGLAQGQWTSLDERSHPPLLVDGIAMATQRGDTAAVAHLRVLLSAYHEPTWTDAGWGVRWCWLMNGGAPPTIICTGWTGIIVDGRWLGWHRGRLDVDHLIGPGLHHVVLADPP